LRGQVPRASEAAASSGAFARQDGNAADAAPPATVGAEAVAACASRYASEGTVRFRASGAYQGTPAVVLGIDTDRRTIVFVVAADNCAQVLYSLSR
jgi:hypothetical protein